MQVKGAEARATEDEARREAIDMRKRGKSMVYQAEKLPKEFADRWAAPTLLAHAPGTFQSPECCPTPRATFERAEIVSHAPHTFHLAQISSIRDNVELCAALAVNLCRFWRPLAVEGKGR